MGAASHAGRGSRPGPRGADPVSAASRAGRGCDPAPDLLFWGRGFCAPPAQAVSWEMRPRETPPFYSDALQCADRSGAADVGGRRYTYWLLPANGEDACVASDGKYSLVVAVNERGADDAALSTVENAELYGMKVYLGMPIPQMGQPGTSGYPAYVADDSYMGTLGAFTRNLLRS